MQEAEENQRTIVALREQVRRQEIEILHLAAGPGAGAGGAASQAQLAALSASTTRQSMDTGGGAGKQFGASGRSQGQSPSPRGHGQGQGQGLGSSALLQQSQSGLQQPLGSMPKQPGEQWVFLFRADLQKAMDTPNKCRLMTLNETKDIINQLFQSKALSNGRAAAAGNAGAGGLLVETMEMHVYRTMEKKYGLRSLAAEHTGALLTSAHRLEQQDNAVRVFVKVFSNEVEEEFREVQTELSRSIADLLRVQLMAK
jgi:hypothetical protein